MSLEDSGKFLKFDHRRRWLVGWFPTTVRLSVEVFGIDSTENWEFVERERHKSRKRIGKGEIEKKQKNLPFIDGPNGVVLARKDPRANP